MPSSHARPAAAARSSLARAPVATRTRSAAMRSPEASVDSGRAAVAVDRREPRAEPDIDAARAVQRVEEAGDRFAGDALHHPALGLDHDGIAVLLAKHRRDLEPDVAAADDGDAARIVERRAQPPDVVDLAQREHAGELDAGQRQIARARAGCEHQRVVVVSCAVVQLDLLSRQIDRADQPHRDRARPCGRPNSFRGGAAASRSRPFPSGRPWTAAAAGTAHRARRRPCGWRRHGRPGAG